MSDEPHEELFDVVRGALRTISPNYIRADGAIDAIQFNLRNAERELTELREAATGVCWQALSTDAAEGMRVVPTKRIEALQAVLAKVRR